MIEMKECSGNYRMPCLGCKGKKATIQIRVTMGGFGGTVIALCPDCAKELKESLG